MRDGAPDRPPIGGFAKVIDNIPTAVADVLGIVPMWFWETDADHRFCYFSDSWCRLTHAKKAPYLGMSRRDYFVKISKHSEAAKQHLEDLENHRPFRDFVYRHQFQKGQLDWVTTSGDPLFDEDGKFLGYRGAAMILSGAVNGSKNAIKAEQELLKRAKALEEDVARRQAETEKTNQLLSEVVEAMGDGLMVTSGTEADDPDNRIILTNRAYRRLFNLRKGDIPPNMPLPDYLQLLASRGESARVMKQAKEVNQMLAAGETVMMEVPSSNKFFHTTAAKRPSGGYVLVHTDVTDMQERNLALAKAKDAAEVANQTKSNFLATMSHEIRTPMNGIVGMADLLADTDLSVEQKEFVDTIKGSAVALTTLISDILDFSKIEAGRLELAHEPYDIRALLREVRDLVGPLAKERGLVLNLDIADNLPAMMMGDGLRLRQVLLNLLGNAIKFTDQGVVEFSAAINEGLVIQVSDSGIGIPVDQLQKIFDPFEQVDSSQSRQHQGTGLGLAITKSLIRAMNGDIFVESSVGHGTDIEVLLPLVLCPGSQPSKSLTDAEVEDLTGMRVLLVEDNKTNQLVVRRILERCGVEITIANNGREAVEKFDPDAVDLVLMDLSMPLMTGLEAAREIRARQLNLGWPYRPILALTGNAFKRDEDRALAAGMDGFLTKPIRKKTLLLALNQHRHTTKETVHPVLEALRKKKATRHTN
ncbi:response regulator [Tropicibacter sp. R15_0]|uniref:ATP-binding protein n=1 Tax=Tropicibacter sp. R15_0 TaxID=2821101 RepID=UPI001AD9718C|nr:ATP-binding protein [Tropicibacter sp. R15_0]MBO9464716.1 response regulator [Tropicibacter sp. R15_0]